MGWLDALHGTDAKYNAFKKAKNAAKAGGSSSSSSISQDNKKSD
jgi:hypothetical protein